MPVRGPDSAGAGGVLGSTESSKKIGLGKIESQLLNGKLRGLI
jgi:hypothetical protein